MTYSLEELIELGRKHAEHVLIGKPGAQLLPTFHIQFKDRPPMIMATPWRSETDKRVTIAAMRGVLKEVRQSVVNYSFISEAWLAVQNHRPRASDLMPSEREDRKEAVIITACDHDGGTLRAFEIKRGSDSAVTELTPEKEPGKFDHFEGRMFNMLQDDDERRET